MAGCKEEKFVGFEETTLETAYHNGWITQDQLKSIAYYYNGETENPEFEVIPKAPLSRETEDKIKLSYLQRKSIKETYPNATIGNIGTYRYYGTYNNCAVVFIKDNLFMYDLLFEPERIIGGVYFYNYCELFVYKLM